MKEPHPLATITIEELRGMQKGEAYMVKLIDNEHVLPEARGRIFDIDFIGLAADNTLDMIDLDDPNCLMVEGKSRAPGDRVMKYAFHGWLIDEIKALAIT